MHRPNAFDGVSSRAVRQVIRNLDDILESGDVRGPVADTFAFWANYANVALSNRAYRHGKMEDKALAVLCGALWAAFLALALTA